MIKRRIGIICAVDPECRELVAGLKKKRREISGNVHIYSGFHSDKEVIMAVSGTGKTNAAHGCTVLIERYRPDLVLNIGVGGCFPGKGLEIGDLAIAERELFADEGVLVSSGFLGVKEMGMHFIRKGKRKFYNEFPAGAGLIGKFRKIERKLPYRFTYGTFLTVSTVTGTLERARYLSKKFDAICENMEGAAVFQVSHSYGVPCFEIRGISNIVEDRDKRKWRIGTAASRVQDATGLFMESL